MTERKMPGLPQDGQASAIETTPEMVDDGDGDVAPTPTATDVLGEL